MVLPQVTDAQRRARLGRRHRLAGRARVDDVATITDSLVAVHSTDPATVYLSLAVRMATPSLAAVGEALYDARSVVRHHGMRRTIWVYTPATARTVHAACTAAIATKEWQQLAKWVALSGIEQPEEWIGRLTAATLDAVRRLGPCSARQLGRAEPALATKLQVGNGKFVVDQSAHTRLLLNLGFDGAVVRTMPIGTWVSGEYQWCVTADWLAEGFTGEEPAAARGELAARYLRAFGPATAADLQWWAGWTVGATKAALAACSAVEVALDGGRTGWLLPDDLADDAGGVDVDDEPWAALLPGLDSTAMGWKHREWYLGEWGAFGGPLFDKNGNIGPTVWWNGEVVGAWGQRADGSVVHELVRPVDRAGQRAIDAAADQLHALLGPTRVAPRYPTPLQTALASS